MNNLLWIEEMFYGKILYLLIHTHTHTHTHTHIHTYIYIYIYIYIYNNSKPETVHQYWPIPKYIVPLVKPV